MIGRGSRGPAAGRPDMTDEYRAALAAIGDACEHLAAGDFNVRIPPLPGGEEPARIRERVNTMVDIMDAFVREARAALGAAAEGRYYRRFLLTGMAGAFRDAAADIDDARNMMAESAEGLAKAQQQRGELTESAHEVSAQVAAASTELGASAASLAESTNSAVGVAIEATRTVEVLDATSKEIEEAVTAIKRVAGQTRLLALNASIEAARAAEAGRGFAVVANEVKTLADEVTQSSQHIDRQVETVRGVALETVESIRRISDLITDMDGQVSGIAAAATSGLAGVPGLAEMAERLRAEIYRLMAEV